MLCQNFLPTHEYAIRYGKDGEEGAAIPTDTKMEILSPIRSPDGRQMIFRVRWKLFYLMSEQYAVGPGVAVPVGVNPVTNFPGYNGNVEVTYADHLTGDPSGKSVG